MRAFPASEISGKFLPILTLSQSETQGPKESAGGPGTHRSDGQFYLASTNDQSTVRYPAPGSCSPATYIIGRSAADLRKKAGGSSEQSTCDGPLSRVRYAALRLPPIKMLDTIFPTLRPKQGAKLTLCRATVIWTRRRPAPGNQVLPTNDSRVCSFLSSLSAIRPIDSSSNYQESGSGCRLAQSLIQGRHFGQISPFMSGNGMKRKPQLQVIMLSLCGCTTQYMAHVRHRWSRSRRTAPHIVHMYSMSLFSTGAPST